MGAGTVLLVACQPNIDVAEPSARLENCSRRARSGECRIGKEGSEANQGGEEGGGS